MIPAAVGFQCPECVRLGRSSVRQTRTVFGGRVTANPHAATYALIGLNVLAFLGEIASASFVNRFWQYGAMYSYGTQHATGGIADGQYYRLLTSMFLHEPPSAGGAFFLHILFNMWALVRRRTPARGTAWPGQVRGSVPAHRPRRLGSRLTS